MVKRIFDFITACCLLLLIAPFLFLLILVTRLKLGSPIFFTQIRPGLHGKPFLMIKFRTMTDSKDSSGNMLPDSDRLTPFGFFLRSTSLDELPELWNVIKGEMSLVGPRPLLIEYLPLYNEEQAKRHDVKPGITGWAQINGRNALSWEDKFKLDVWYVDNKSFLLDCKILLLTILKTLRKDGINQPGQATTEKFKGSPVQNGN